MKFIVFRVVGKRKSTSCAVRLMRESRFFGTIPLPNNEWEFTIKNEPSTEQTEILNQFATSQREEEVDYL